MSSISRLGNDLAIHNDHVKILDPLQLDSALSQLWEMNAQADVDGIAVILRRAIPSAEKLSAFSPSESLAAMRDLGLVVGSIKRHGPEPVDVVPEVEPVLLELGTKTNMVPRDTVHHYSSWNPVGPRERLYTGEPMERMLISSVRACLPGLTGAVEACRRLSKLEPDDPEFVTAAKELARLLGSMEDSINTVIAGVSPEFFARTMRPYFEEVRIGGATYLGPAAAHVPLSLVDLLLWASDHGDETYEKFWRESAHYGLPQWRDLYGIWEKSPSLITRVISGLELGPGGTPILHASAEALCRALRALIVFRGKHLTIARKAYRKEVRLYALGSGGGSLDLLSQLVLLTRENVNMVRNAFAPPATNKGKALISPASTGKTLISPASTGKTQQSSEAA